MSSSDKDDFNSTVKAFITLHDEIAKSAKQMRELKKQKDLLGVVILKYMRTEELDQCELADGKLSRRISKRTEGLKKEYVYEELVRLAGNENGANEALNNINSRRGIKEVEVLSRTVSRRA
jgi:Family of unknown function (DUF5760)